MAQLVDIRDLKVGQTVHIEWDAGTCTFPVKVREVHEKGVMLIDDTDLIDYYRYDDATVRFWDEEPSFDQRNSTPWNYI